MIRVRILRGYFPPPPFDLAPPSRRFRNALRFRLGRSRDALVIWWPRFAPLWWIGLRARLRIPFAPKSRSRPFQA